MKVAPQTISGPFKEWTAERKTIWLTFIVIIGFFAATAWHYYFVAYYNVPYPLNTFFFRPSDRFGDFYNGLPDMANFYSKPSWDRAVMPFPLLFFRMVALRIVDPRVIHALFLGSFIIGSLLYVSKHLPFGDNRIKWLVGTVLVVFSYPFLFCIDRSNFECLIFLILCMFITDYARGNRTRAILWAGLALAMKPYAGVFFALFLIDGKVLDAVKAGVIAAILAIGAFMLQHGDLAVIKKSGEMYNDGYVIGNEGFYFSASLWTGMKAAIESFTSYGIVGVDCRPDTWNIHLPFRSHYFEFATPEAVQEFFRHLMHGYFIFSALTFLFVVGCLFAFRIEFWKRIALLTCCMNLLPYVCGHYRLVHTFLALALFIKTPTRSRLDPVYVGIFGLLLIPKSYFHFSFAPVFQVHNFELSEAVFLDPLLMSALALLILGTAIASRSWSARFVNLCARFGLKLQHTAENDASASFEPAKQPA